MPLYKLKHKSPAPKIISKKLSCFDLRLMWTQIYVSFLGSQSSKRRKGSKFFFSALFEALFFQDRFKTLSFYIFNFLRFIASVHIFVESN